MAVSVAPRLKRRALERQGMTREQELELLIQEQQADDTDYIERPSHVISLDAPAPDGDGTLGDLIGFDYQTDEMVVLFPLPASPPLANASQHGTIYAYKRLACRCKPCCAAHTAYIADWRKRKRAAS